MYSQVRACLRCRRKKVRCDGARPACYQCEKASVPEDCIYGEEANFYGLELLEDRIDQLKERIALIENSASGPIVLHDPYALFHERQQGLGTGSRSRQETPPDDVAQALILSFSGIAAQAGFFLPRLRLYMMASTPPATTPPVHASALLNAVYLFGAYVSDDVRLQGLQDGLLDYALEDLSAALVDLGAPAIADVVQTEVLLTTYLISCNRRVEGIYHLDGASALLLASRLHGAQRRRDFQPVANPQPTRPGDEGHQYADRIEEEERARVNWAVIALDSCWASILRRAPRLVDAIPYVSTLPQAIAGIAEPMGILNAGNQYASHAADAQEDHLLWLHAQAASMYCSAAQMSAQLTDDPTTYLLASGEPELAGRIAAFQQNLPPLNTQDVGQDPSGRLPLVHLLVNCATVQLHQPLDLQVTMGIPTNSQTFAAAYVAVNVLSKSNIRALTFVDPAVGPMLLSVADVLINALRFLRARVSATSVLVDVEEQSVVAALAQIRSVITAWSERSAYMKTQLIALQGMLEEPIESTGQLGHTQLA